MDTNSVLALYQREIPQAAPLPSAEVRSESYTETGSIFLDVSMLAALLVPTLVLGFILWRYLYKQRRYVTTGVLLLLAGVFHYVLYLTVILELLTPFFYGHQTSDFAVAKIYNMLNSYLMFAFFILGFMLVAVGAVRLERRLDTTSA